MLNQSQEIKKSIKTYALIFLFIVSNFLAIIFSYIISESLIVALYKWIQIFILLFLLSFVFKKYKNLALSLLTILYFSYFCLVGYLLLTGSSLSLAFFVRNFVNLSFIFKELFVVVVILALLSFFNSYFIFKLSKTIFINKILAVVLLVFTLVAWPFSKLNNELFLFIKSFYNPNSIIGYYQQNVYNKLIDNNIKQKDSILSQAANLDKSKLDKTLENIIIVQAESINSFLVTPQNTPVFLDLAKKGIFFPKIYGNGVQTILAQENILCGLPTSFDFNLVDSGFDEEIVCLPEILSQAGYKSFFLKSYNLKFAKTGEFMKNIGFDDMQADSIMETNDPVYKWGYREDVFLQRAFEYLSSQKEKNNFIYLSLGPTNHWPFSTPKEYIDNVPFKNPATTQEKLINTTYLQDMHLQNVYSSVNQLFPEKNYTLIVMGDHSWPAGLHQGNTFNEKGAYEENFATAAVVIFGDGKHKGEVVRDVHTHMDWMPTILDWFDISYPNSNFSASIFYQPSDKKLLINPFTDKYLNVIWKDEKYSYNAQQNKLFKTNIKNDLAENNYIELSDADNLQSFKNNILNPYYLDTNHVIVHALGAINFTDYTNSLEAFNFNYNRGQKVFEMDFSLTKDQKLVGWHNAGLGVNLEEFKNTKIKEKYTSLDINDIYNLMQKHKDIYLVTDMKDDFALSFNELIKTFSDKEVLDRVIPQIYNENDYYILEKQHSFPKIIYTLYATRDSDEKVLEFIKKYENIEIITSNQYRFSPYLLEKVHDLKKEYFIHTLNDYKVIERYLSQGVDGIYSDYY